MGNGASVGLSGLIGDDDLDDDGKHRPGPRRELDLVTLRPGDHVTWDHDEGGLLAPRQTATTLQASTTTISSSSSSSTHTQQEAVDVHQH